MKIRRKIAAMLAFVVLTGSMTVGAFAASADDFKDMPDDWSRAALTHAVENGLLHGSDGLIDPQGLLTRAQMAAIVNRAFGAETTGDISGFTDVLSSEWYYTDMQKAVYMGTFQGSNGKLNPDSAISRQEALSVLARAFRLSDGADSALAGFSDAGEVASWAKGSVAALVAAGYVSGSNGKLNPEASITRAEFAQVMDNLLPVYLPEKFGGTVDGNAMVRTAGTVLDKATIKGDLVIGDGVGDGNVTLRDTKVEGRLVVRGGGIHSIIITGSSNVGSVVVSKVGGNVRVSAENGASLSVVVVDDGKDDVIIEGTVDKVEVTASEVPVVLQNAAVNDVVISGGSSTVTVDKASEVKTLTVSEAAKDTAVSVSGKVTDVKTEAAGTALTVSGTGKIDTVAVSDTASNSTVTADKGATVSKVETAASGTEVKGDGKVDKVEAQAGSEGTKVTTPSTNVTADKDAGAVDVGKSEAIEPGDSGKTEGTTPSGGSSGSSGGSSGPSYTVVNDADTLKAALEAGGYVRLGDDIDLRTTAAVPLPFFWYNNSESEWVTRVNCQITIPPDKTATLDLSGHEITSEVEGYIICNRGTLTINGTTANSAIKNSSTEANDNKRCLLNFEGKLTLNGGTYEGDYAVVTNRQNYKKEVDGAVDGDEQACKDAVTIATGITANAKMAGFANFTNSETTLTNSTVKSQWYALSNNGTYGNTEFHITDSRLTSTDGTAIYFPAGDLLQLTDVTVEAASGGIEAFAGDVTLQGSTSITVNGGSFKSDEAVKSVGSGESIEDGSAILMGYRAGYKTTGALKVTIGEGVTLKSKVGHCIRIAAVGTYAEDNGVRSITLDLPDTIPDSWESGTEKAIVHNQLTDAYRGSVAINSDALVKAQIADFASKLENDSVAMEAVLGQDNAYNVSFTSTSISGTGAIDLLGEIKGLTSVTVSDGTGEDATYTKAVTNGSEFKTAVMNKFPQSNGGPVELTVTFKVYGHDTAIKLNVTNAVPTD